MSSIYSRLSRIQIISLFAISVPALIFFDLAEDIWFLEGFWWDEQVALAIHRLTNPVLTMMVRFVTFTGGYGAYPIFLFIALRLLHRGQKQRALMLSISFIGSAVLNLLLKAIFVRPRPSLFDPLIAVGGYSFPSGHSIAGITLYGVLGFYLWHDHRRGWAVAAGVWGMLVGLSRIYLGVHYPSDVVAAWMAGMLWIFMTFTTSWLRHHRYNTIVDNLES